MFNDLRLYVIYDSNLLNPKYMYTPILNPLIGDGIYSYYA